MPTGYTYIIEEDPEPTFEKFALTCARAFGALYMMRDDPMDAPIPDEFPASTYNAERLAEAKIALAKAEAMTLEEASRAAADAFDHSMEAYRASLARCEENHRRYERMRAAVKEWVPPTLKHIELKNFMLEQIRISDSGYRPSLPARVSGDAFRRAAVEKALRDINYHTAEHEKELARTRARNEWVRQSRESLKISPPGESPGLGAGTR